MIRSFTTTLVKCIIQHNFSKFPLEQISKNIRQMSTSASSSNDLSARLQKYKPKDIRFETPYGQLSGQEWGNPSAPNKFICLHGWLDNCSSFKPMIPYILDHKNNADKYHIVAFDSSGVGLSCHRPVGTEYTQMGAIVEIKRVVDILKWKSYSIIGHSMGSGLGFLYSCIFREEVKCLVSIDLAFPFFRSTENWNHTLAKSIRTMLMLETHGDNDPTTNFKVAVYSREEAIQKLVDSHGMSLTRQSAEILLERGAKKESWGYIFNRDLRLRNNVLEFWASKSFMIDLMRQAFKTNLLVILAKESVYLKLVGPEMITHLFGLYSKQCGAFKSVWLPGTHHLHMNDPQPVAAAIIEFLDTNLIDSKLESKL